MSKHYAVIGRIPFDDEDTTLVYKAGSREDAVRSFADDMYEQEPPELRKDNIKEHGGDLGVFITTVLVSDTEISFSRS